VGHSGPEVGGCHHQGQGCHCGGSHVMAIAVGVEESLWGEWGGRQCGRGGVGQLSMWS
jgi:hypothetical protein